MENLVRRTLLAACTEHTLERHVTVSDCLSRYLRLQVWAASFFSHLGHVPIHQDWAVPKYPCERTWIPEIEHERSLGHTRDNERLDYRLHLDAGKTSPGWSALRKEGANVTQLTPASD